MRHWIATRLRKLASRIDGPLTITVTIPPPSRDDVLAAVREIEWKLRGGSCG